MPTKELVRVAVIEEDQGQVMATQELLEDFAIVVDLGNIRSVDEMNELMFKISSYLVNDRQKLSRWIAGIQFGYANQFVLLQQLLTDAKELELLKEFFASRIETLKLRIEELLNEKEDYSAMHQSDSTIKEYLTKRLSE